MIRTVTLLMSEGAITLAWAWARFGVKLLPKDHPLKKYHEFSEERIRPIYKSAPRAERAKHVREKWGA